MKYLNIFIVTTMTAALVYSGLVLFRELFREYRRSQEAAIKIRADHDKIIYLRGSQDVLDCLLEGMEEFGSMGSEYTTECFQQKYESFKGSIEDNATPTQTEESGIVSHI